MAALGFEVIVCEKILFLSKLLQNTQKSVCVLSLNFSLNPEERKNTSLFVSTIHIKRMSFKVTKAERSWVINQRSNYGLVYPKIWTINL